MASRRREPSPIHPITGEETEATSSVMVSDYWASASDT
jgi:hypothetical protein